MQFIAMITLLFAASALAAPAGVFEKRMSTTGVNNYGDDGVASKTDPQGDIVRFTDGALTATGKA